MSDRPPIFTPADFEQIYQAALSRPRPVTPAFIEAEKARCKEDPVYFIDRYCQIYDNATAAWIPFKLWEAQIEVVLAIHHNKLTIVLKTRQVGCTWLCLAYALYLGIFCPIASILIWSRTDEDAMELLGDKRLKGIFQRLPDWMKPEVKEDNLHDFGFTNGSIMHALPTTRGDGYTATYAFIDEADLDPNLATRLERSKPTIDARNCKLVLISRTDKSNPGSTFKAIYKGAREKQNAYAPVFIPWYKHPERTPEWYEAECRNSMSTHGSLDEIASNYPTTEIEALAARTLDKRIPPQWLAQVSRERLPLPLPAGAPALSGLKLFALPVEGRRYGIGLDPAGGNADSDDSVAQVVDAETQVQVAVLAGKVEPTQFANQVADVSEYYNGATVLFELNNHGYATLAQLKERHVPIRNGIQRDGTTGKPGWMTSERSKHMLYDVGAKVIQQIVESAREEGTEPVPIIFDFTTTSQLASVDINTLNAPAGSHDDYAMAWVLAQMCIYRGVPSMEQVRHTGLYQRGREDRQGVTVDVTARAVQPKEIAAPKEGKAAPAPPQGGTVKVERGKG